jgi:hypothetical protein
MRACAHHQPRTIDSGAARLRSPCTGIPPPFVLSEGPQARSRRARVLLQSGPWFDSGAARLRSPRTGTFDSGAGRLRSPRTGTFDSGAGRLRSPCTGIPPPFVLSEGPQARSRRARGLLQSGPWFDSGAARLRSPRTGAFDSGAARLRSPRTGAFDSGAARLRSPRTGTFDSGAARLRSPRTGQRQPTAGGPAQTSAQLSSAWAPMQDIAAVTCLQPNRHKVAACRS